MSSIDQTVAMKFIMKQGKSDKDIHSLRQEIEVRNFFNSHSCGIVSPNVFCMLSDIEEAQA